MPGQRRVRSSARRVWFAVGCFLVAVVAFASLLAQAGDVLQTADSLASVASGLIGAASLVLSVVLLRGRPPEAPEDALDAAAAALRAGVRRDWTAELLARRLRQPAPLRLTWRLTGRPAAVTRPAVRDGRLLIDPSGREPAGELVRQFRRLRTPQLVIRGEPGSGKSTVAALFLVAALAEHDRVPVLLPLAGWRPDLQPLAAWAAEWIEESYPELANPAKYGPDAPRELLAQDRVLLILDGMDEMAPSLAAPAVRQLSGVATATVITCRSGDYDKIVQEVGRLPMAAEVTIEPVGVDDAVAFLAGGEDPADAVRWDGVATVLRADHQGPLARALSTPLMIALARAAFQPRRTSPDELLALDSREAVERHLLDRFLAGAYPDRRSERHLATLARHLRHRLFSPNLTWWALSTAVPSAVLMLLVATVVAAGGALSCAVLRPFAGGVRVNVEMGLMLSLAVGVVAALGAARGTRTRPGGGRLARTLLMPATMIRDVCAAAATLTAAGFVIDLADDGVRWNALTYQNTALVAAGIAAAFSLVNNVLGGWRGSLPAQPSWRLSRLPVALLRGVGTGLAYGLPLGLVIGLVIGLRDYDPADPIAEWAGVLAAGLTPALLVALAITAALALPIGIGRWLATPLDDQVPVSPRSALRTDRVIALLVAVSAAVSAGAGAAAFVLYAPGLLRVGEHSSGRWDGPAWLAFAAFAAVLFGGGSPSVAYALAGGWLAAWGRLPWNIVGFLEDAHATRQILRQVGPVYQFRHDRLEEHLAGPAPAGRRLRPEARTFGDAAERQHSERVRAMVANETTGYVTVIIVIVVAGLVLLGGQPFGEDVLNDRLDRRSELAAQLLLRADRLAEDRSADAWRLRIAAAEIDPDSSSRAELATFLRMRATSPAVAWARVGDSAEVGRWRVVLRPDHVAVAWDLSSADRRPRVLATGVTEIAGGSDTFVVLRSRAGLQVWRLTGTPERVDVRLPDGSLAAVGNRWLAMHGADGTGRLWDLTRPAAAISLGPGVRTISFDPDENWVLSRTEAGRMSVWDLRGPLDAPAGAMSGPFFGGIVGARGDWLLAGDDFFGEFTALRPADSATRDFDLRQRCTTSSEGQCVVRLVGQNHLLRFDGRRMDLVDLEHPDEVTTLVADVAAAHFGPDYQAALVVTTDGRAHLVDLTGAAPVVRDAGTGVDPLRSWITGRWAMVNRSNGTGRLWSIDRGIRAVADGPAYNLHYYYSPRQFVGSAGVSGDEAWAFVDAVGGSPYLWHLGTDRPVPLRLSVPDGGDWTGAFGDGAAVAAVPGGESMMWRLTNAGQISETVRLGPAISAVELGGSGSSWGLFWHGTPDDRSVYTKTPQPLLTSWPIGRPPVAEAADPWREACDRAGPPLTRARWIDLVPTVPYRKICQERGAA
ncbi:NACHT domain-containing protein [Actinoplanes sp. NPDC026619]|uniref:NACHT domain-containing protein n=1 Tax=Actinoplanes sp. NPDC026619 TaxID=3155798 RepID=UPI003406DB51